MKARSDRLVELRISLTSFAIYLLATREKMAVGATFYWFGEGGLRGCEHASSANFEKWKYVGNVFLHSEQKCVATLNWNPPLCVESPRYWSAARLMDFCLQSACVKTLLALH